LTYNTGPVTCSSFPNTTFAPIVIWLGIAYPAGSISPVLYDPNTRTPPNNASAVICSPSLSVSYVKVTVNVDNTIDDDNIEAIGPDSVFEPTAGAAINGLWYPTDKLDFRAGEEDSDSVVNSALISSRTTAC
jgi:hypothetical protein